MKKFFMDEFSEYRSELSKEWDFERSQDWPELATTRGIAGSNHSGTSVEPLKAQKIVPRAFPVVHRMHRQVVANPSACIMTTQQSSRVARAEFRKCLTELKLQVSRARKDLAIRRCEHDSTPLVALLERFRARRYLTLRNRNLHV